MATQNSINNRSYVFNSDTSITAATDITATAGNITVGATSANANAKSLLFNKSRTGGVITTGDALGSVEFTGHDGTGYIVGSKITSTSSGTIGTDRVASDLQFYTHPDSTSASTLRMTINNAGCVTIAAPDAGTALTVTAGGVTATAGNFTASAGNLVLTAGDANVGNIAAADTAPFVNFKKSRAGSDITTGDILGSVTFQGYAPTSGYVTGASITSTSSGTIAENRVAGDLVFATHPNSATGLTPTTRLTIGPAGNLTIAAPDAGTALTITDGGLTVTSGATTLTPLAGTNGGVMVSSTAGVLSHVENPTTDGQLLISKADGSNPIWASLTAGSNITITPGANSITIAATGGGSTNWTTETGDFTIAMGSYYLCNKVSLVTATLPATATAGTWFKLAGMNSGGWKIAQNSGQSIIFNGNTSTSGATGYLASTANYDAVEIVCVVDNTTFQVVGSNGNITVA